MRYSIELRERRYVKGYGFLSFSIYENSESKVFKNIKFWGEISNN